MRAREGTEALHKKVSLPFMPVSELVTWETYYVLIVSKSSFIIHPANISKVIYYCQVLSQDVLILCVDNLQR